jgi:hypothetical protein
MSEVKVCPQAFAKAHYRGHTYYDRLVRELKNGAVNGNSNMFAKHCSIRPSDVAAIMKNNTYGIKLTTAEFTAATLPKTLKAVYTASWMNEFFRLTGMFLHHLLCSQSDTYYYLDITFVFFR